MKLHPYNPDSQRIKTEVTSKGVDRAFVSHLELTSAHAVVADNDGVLVATTDTGAEQIITTGIGELPMPRNITATSGGTGIAAAQVTIKGIDYDGKEITETLPVFTAGTPTTVEGAKAFREVTEITLPTHGGTTATVSIGFGDILGLPFKLEHPIVLGTFLNDVEEGTAPTVTTSATNLENNTIKLNSALNGTAVDIYMIV